MAAEPAPRSLEQRFARAAAWVTGAALVVLALASWAWAEHLNREAARRIAQRDLKWQATRAGDALAGVENRLRELATSPLLQTALTDSSARLGYLQPSLDSIRTIEGIPVQLAVVDFEGRVIAGHPSFGLAPGEIEWYRAGLGTEATRASVGGAGGDARIRLTLGIVYQRSHTVEGSVWASMRVADVPQDPTHRLHVTVPPAAAPAQSSPLALPAPLGELPLAMVRHGGPPPVARDNALVVVFVAVAALLVLAAGVAARWLARSLTRDLGRLERFAGQVALTGVVEARAPGSGPQEVASLAGSINRMLDRLREQHQALESESQRQLNLLATCIAKLGDAVLITGVAAEGVKPRFPIVFANPAFERMTGYTVAEVLGRSPAFLQGPDTDRDELRRLDEALRRNEPVRVELLNYHKSGARYWVEMEIVPVRDEAGQVRHFVAIERDNTERRALEEQLRQSQKMEAIGTLAGGIAHDFNNVLAAILGNVALSRHDLHQGQPVEHWLDQIGKSAERARALVQQILAFSRRRPQDRSPQELGGLVGETVAMLRATVPAGVRIVTQLPAEPVIVLGDSTALEQVLLNLGTNAWQALEGRGGQITYGLVREQPPGEPPCAHLWVQDDGCGMDEATKRRIFEPYFTTKPVGRGTGLGLAVVEGIVREHGGRITVDSEPGRGAVFHLRLPLTVAPARPAAPAPVPAAAAPPAGTALSGHVLYVDDDEVLVEVVGAQLERWGCRVTVARSAPAAIEIVRGDPARFDVVVSDVNMPGKSGVELARELGAIRPDLPVVLASGYVSDELLTAVPPAGVRAVVHKERMQDDLRRVLAELLGAATSAAKTPG